MALTASFATRLPVGIKKKLDEVCLKLGLRKNFVVESALREKLEDLLDTYDLTEAEKQATDFKSWHEVKKELKQNWPSKRC